MNNMDIIERILNENNLVLKDSDEVRLILGISPFPDKSIRTKMAKPYPFEVASFITSSFEEKIQLFCVMNLFFGLENTKILIEKFKQTPVSGSDFVLFLEREANIYFGNVSDIVNLKKFLSTHSDTKILCCGDDVLDSELLLDVPSQNRFAIANPSNVVFRLPSAVKEWLLFNHSNSSQIKQIFSLI